MESSHHSTCCILIGRDMFQSRGSHLYPMASVIDGRILFLFILREKCGGILKGNDNSHELRLRAGSKHYQENTLRARTVRGCEKYQDVNFCKDHRDKTEVPDPLAVEDLISYKSKNRRKLATLIT